MPWLQELKDIIKKQRKHSGFFEWPHKGTKELGVVKCLLESLEKAGCCPYSNPHSAKKDPPDCIAQDKSGNIVGIEVSELVDLETVRDAQKNKSYPKYWNKKEVLDQIQSIISKKDQKKFQGGPYSRIVLLIFTDETFLERDDAISYLQRHKFVKTNQIDEIYLLFSYGARYRTYPFVKLESADNNRINSD
jgi:hypothetical protein